MDGRLQTTKEGIEMGSFGQMGMRSTLDILGQMNIIMLKKGLLDLEWEDGKDHRKN